MIDTDYAVTKSKIDEGLHFLHAKTCQVLPPEDELIDIGRFDGCEAAIEAARREVSPVNGCALCCGPCHELTSEGPDYREAMKGQ